MDVLGADGDFARTANIFAEVGNAEAAFALGVAALGMNDYGIDEDEPGVGIFLEGDVDDSDAAGDADLRGGQADAVGDVHRLEHVFGELFQFLVEDGDFLGWLLENWAAEFYDGVDHFALVRKLTDYEAMDSRALSLWG